MPHTEHAPHQVIHPDVVKDATRAPTGEVYDAASVSVDPGQEHAGQPVLRKLTAEDVNGRLSAVEGARRTKDNYNISSALSRVALRKERATNRLKDNFAVDALRSVMNERRSRKAEKAVWDDFAPSGPATRIRNAKQRFDNWRRYR